MTARFRGIGRAISAWRRDMRGAAAVEFALVLTLLAIPILNVVDVGIYVFQRMEVDNAAQVAAQAAWAIVPNCTLPLTNPSSNCSALSGKMTTAAHSTPLGSNVSVSSAENYYCVKTATSQLVPVGTFPTKPSPDNCAAAGGLSTDTPGDYLIVTASYTYTPVFSGVSVVDLLGSTITRKVWMRLGSA